MLAAMIDLVLALIVGEVGAEMLDIEAGLRRRQVTCAIRSSSLVLRVTSTILRSSGGGHWRASRLRLLHQPG